MESVGVVLLLYHQSVDFVSLKAVFFWTTPGEANAVLSGRTTNLGARKLYQRGSGREIWRSDDGDCCRIRMPPVN
jgi:hypothetical protein